MGHVLHREAAEQDHLVDAVEELGPEAAAQLAHHRLARFLHVLAAHRHQMLRADIGGHDDQRVAEIDRAALPVRQAAVIQHLKEDIEHVRVRLLDLVEQDHLIGSAAHRLGQGPAFLVSDIAGRRADDAGDRVLFHIFGHVEAGDGVFVVEQELGQSLGQLRLADAGGPQEHEAANGAVGVLQAGAGAAHGV